MSEFGFEANRNGPVEERGTYQFQIDAAEYHLGVFASKPYLAGAMWFALRPSQRGRAGPAAIRWETRRGCKGEIDQFGNPTPLFGIIQSIYRSTVQIGPAAAVARARN